MLAFRKRSSSWNGLVQQADGMVLLRLAYSGGWVFWPCQEMELA